MLICITNRKLCKNDFIQQIKNIALAKPGAIMLREKDLSLTQYEELAILVKEICDDQKVPLIINKNIDVAAKLGVSKVHLSMRDLETYKDRIGQFQQIGASIHSITEAKKAEKLGASYLIAGHIFPTNSKRGLPARGLTFLEDVCKSVNIPVYAIGGITTARVKDVLTAGAKGLCIMSEPMLSTNPTKTLEDFYERKTFPI